MSNNGAGVAKAVVPLTPKSNVKSPADDQLDRAGQAILGALHRAAGAAEALPAGRRNDPQIIRSASSR